MVNSPSRPGSGRNYDQTSLFGTFWGEGARRSAQFSADIEEFLPSLLANRFRIKIAELVESLRDRLAGGSDHGGRIAVSAAGGFLEDAVDHAESQHVLRRDLHAVGRLLGLGAVPPQDRGSRLRRDHA